MGENYSLCVPKLDWYLVVCPRGSRLCLKQRVVVPSADNPTFDCSKIPLQNRCNESPLKNKFLRPKMGIM